MTQFSGGYQFPRTASAALRRGPAVKTAERVGPSAATLRLVALEGARQPTWDLVASWLDMVPVAGEPPRPTEVTHSILLTGASQQEAEAAFAELALGFEEGIFPRGLAP